MNITSVPITDVTGGDTLSSPGTEKVAWRTVDQLTVHLVTAVTTVLLPVTLPPGVDTEPAGAGELLTRYLYSK